MEVKDTHSEGLRGTDRGTEGPCRRTWSLTSGPRAWGQGGPSAHQSPPFPRNVRETLPLSPAGDLGALGINCDPAVWI